MVEKQVEQVITADMSIGDVIQKYPDAVEVFFRHGLGCIGCAAARFENISQGAMAHGIDINVLMKDLNAAVA